mgnify:CR=1 FL=1|tara:strand:- start:354 stop:623 length:270 start_codon:yes stop_codon:yes gene_type:complete
MAQRKWIPTVINMLEKSGMRSVDIERELHDKFRHAPSARSITATLRGDMRFCELGEDYNFSLFKRKSHLVKVWGLRGMKYSEMEPYERL